MAVNPDDYPAGFAEYVQPLLDARNRTLRMMNQHEKLVCRYILEAFPEMGRGPMLHEIVENVRLPEENVAACLTRLDDIDMLKYDEDTGQVLVLYPLSTIPCPHRVQITGKKPIYAM
jgi:hypothetical protein